MYRQPLIALTVIVGMALTIVRLVDRRNGRGAWSGHRVIRE